MTAKKNLSCSLLLASALLAIPSLKATLPITTSANLTVGYPLSGTPVTPSTSGGTGALTITSTATTTVLNWGNFWDGTANGGSAQAGDSINFALPGATSAILNVISGNATTINAPISSNGKLFFLNPSGITIGASATVNAASFYASTVLENASYFEQNGSLQVFSSTPPVQTTNGAIVVTNGASFTIAGGTGDVRLAGNGITIGGGTIAANVYLVDTGSSTPGPVNVGTAAAENINATGGSAGNLTITTTNGAVNLSDGFATTVQGNLVVTSNGGTVDVGQTGATNVTGTASITTTATSTNGNIIDTAGTLTVTGNTTTLVTGTGSGAADGTISIPTLATNSVISITGGATTIANAPAGGTTTLGTVTVSGNLSISTTGNLTTQNFGSTASTPAIATVNGTNSTIALTADSASAGSKTLTFNGTGAENFATIAAGGAADAATITTTGNITLSTAAAVSVPSLSLTTTSGTITQTTGSAAGSISSATLLTLNAPTITLANTSNAFAAVKLVGGASGATLTDDASTLTIANGTSVTGNTTITNEHISGTGATNIALGSVVGDSMSFGGNLSLNLTWAAGAPATQEVLTNAGTITVSGNTTVVSAAQNSTAANDLIQLGNSATATPSYTFTGPIGVTFSGGPGSLAGNINIFGTSGVILGTVNTGTGATLTVASTLTGTANNGISNPSGTVTGGGAVTLAAGTLAAPSNIQIGTTTSPAALTGTITDNTANNLTLVNSVATTIAAGTNPISGQTSITQTGGGAASAVTISDSMAKLSIADTGTSPTGNVSVTIPTGNVALSNWTVGGDATVTPTVTVTNGSITLGAGINDVNLGATTFTSTGALAGISDTASSPVLIYGAVIFNSDGAINVSNNTSSSLGGISLNATKTSVASNNSNMTYIEGSGVNLQAISAPAGYTGTVAVTSVNSIVLETAASVLTLPTTGTLTLTANSINGAVLLNNTAGASNAIQAPISVTATGNSAISTNQNMTLGNINITSGNFTADSTALAAATITEGTGDTAVVSGAGTFITDGGVLSVNQTGNKFGTLTIDTTDAGGATTGANATIKQNTTSVFTSVKTGTTGNFSTTDEAGSITETGNTGAIVGGTTTLASTTGGITFNATGNNFEGQALTITATGNAAVTDTDGVTTLGGGTNVTGSLTVTNLTPGAEIKDNGSSGNVTVGGTAILLLPTTGGSFVNFTGATNSIAGVEIKAGSGTTTFYDNVSLILEPGTVIVGTATISSGGNITTVAGPINFGKVNFNATGSITFTDTGMGFNGLVTAVVTGSSSDVSFSALSLSNNFGGITPSVTTTNNSTLYQAPGN